MQKEIINLLIWQEKTLIFKNNYYVRYFILFNMNILWGGLVVTL